MRSMSIGLLHALAVSSLMFVPPPFAVRGQGEGSAAAGGRQEKSARPEKKSALDDELLKGLGPDPLAGEDEPSAKASSPGEHGAAGTAENEGDTLDRELLKGLGDGEDLGEPGESNPLARLSRAMRDVEALVAQRRTDGETQRRQAQLVRDIDELIRRAETAEPRRQLVIFLVQRRTAVDRRSPGRPARPTTCHRGHSSGCCRRGTARRKPGRTVPHKPDMADMVARSSKGCGASCPSGSASKCYNRMKRSFCQNTRK